ncbi:MAG: hypothetical protein SF029_02245 [bacterium]|nr:hypothetical protein [bacterium]
MTQNTPSYFTRIDRNLAILGGVLVGVFLLWFALALLFQDGVAGRYALLREVHYLLSRAGLIVAGVMLAIAVYIGLIRHGDVTPWFRSATYTIFAFMLMQGLIGGVMWLMGGRPGQEVHLIYGYGVVLSLPFFIFVETTARKRPAMGSYIWGFTLMAAIIVRTITTGPIGG